MTEGERFSPHAPTVRQDDLIRRMLAERGMIDQPVYGSAEDASTLMRDGDYYGGSITVEAGAPNFAGRTHSIEVVWYVWGAYGAMRIRLDGPDEARALAAALTEAAEW